MYTFLDLFRRYSPALVPALLLGAVAYFVVIAVLKRRGRTLSAAWKLWLYVASAYLFAILFMLVLRGGENHGWDWTNLELFFGYKTLTRNFTAHGFINELMNILIFLPFGFFFALPFGERKARWLVIPLGALTSLTVETLQYLTHLGIFDVDDLFNNTLGTVCGFAAARCVLNLRFRNWARGAIALVLTLVCLAPPFVAWAIYDASPYGQSGIDTFDGTPVTGTVSFSDEAESFISGLKSEDLPVYSTPGGTLDEARQCAIGFFSRFGTGIDSEDLYDESAWFRDSSGQRTLIYHYVGPVIEYTDYISEEKLTPGMPENDVRAVALTLGVDIPDGAKFSESDNSYVFTLEDDGQYAGSVTVDYERRISIEYAVYSLKPLGHAAPLGLDDCELALRRGEYVCWDEDVQGDCRIDSAYIDYVLDSKGTYRPSLTLVCGESELHLPLWIE